MNAFYAFWIIGQLFVGICAGLGAATYLWWRKWFHERLRDIEGDVDTLYILNGMTPPSVHRFRATHAERPGPPDD